MTITIEGVQYVLPSSLSDITLQERADYDIMYGRDLRARLKELQEAKESDDRELNMGEYQCDLACKSLSFFGNIPLLIVQNTDLEQVLFFYNHIMRSFSEEHSFTDEDFQLNHEFTWNDEAWVIAHPELKNTSTMTFGEFLDAKQWVKNLLEFANEQWSALIPLCCVFLRKKGEAYTEDLSDPEGERYKLMQTLPLDMAMHVGFFLSASMHTYIKISRSSMTSEEKVSTS